MFASYYNSQSRESFDEVCFSQCNGIKLREIVKQYLCRSVSDDPCVCTSAYTHTHSSLTGSLCNFKCLTCRFDRTAYYTAYRQVYRQDYQTVYKCCPGWSQLNGEAGCLYRKCHEMLEFIIYEITFLHQTEYGNVYSKGSVSSPDSAGARGASNITSRLAQIP